MRSWLLDFASISGHRGDRRQVGIKPIVRRFYSRRLFVIEERMYPWTPMPDAVRTRGRPTVIRSVLIGGRPQVIPELPEDPCIDSGLPIPRRRFATAVSWDACVHEQSSDPESIVFDVEFLDDGWLSWFATIEGETDL